MRALVVYESMFGNSKLVAEAVHEGLQSLLPAELVEVGAAPESLPADLTLLVLGGPTHALGMSRPASRSEAAKQSGEPLVSAGIGVREWVAGLETANVVHGATFDTRVKTHWAPGSAAAAELRALNRRGFDMELGKCSFYVEGTSGPLLPGELERAREWGADLGRRILATRRLV